MSRVALRKLALAIGCAPVALLGCEALQLGASLDAGAPGGGGGGGSADERVAARSLEPGRCPGSGLVPDVSGVFVFAFETVSMVAGGTVAGAQPEAVTRYGVAQLCQIDDQVEAALLVCTFDQGAIVDTDGNCAAQLPGAALLAALPGVRLQGRVDLANQTVSLPGFSETWGLADGASVPAEGDTTGVADQDDDGDPGVTLYGTSAVPTQSWAARATTARIDLQVADVLTLSGQTSSQTVQSIIGGPASRLLEGRERASQPGSAIFVRADGIDGAGVVDQNQDGRVTCAELGPWIGNVLPAPREPACQ